MKPRYHNTGFTLIELLVVSAIFLLLFSLAAAAARPNTASHVRQLSQELSSAILAAQTRAMASDAGAGIVIDSDGTTATAVFTARQAPYLRGFLTHTGIPCNVPLQNPVPFMSGTTVTGTMVSGTTITGTFRPTNGSPSEAMAAYSAKLFRLHSSGTFGAPLTPWITFLPSSSGAQGTIGAAQLTSAWRNQTPHNVILPTGTLGFLLKRLPSTDSPALVFPSSATIDLRYSGIGSSPSAPALTFPSPAPTRIFIGFDRTGALDTVMTQVGLATPVELPQGPLFLLVAARPLGNSLATPSSRWLVIAPTTGRITVAENLATAGTSPAEIRAARLNAIQGISEGAR